MSVLSPFVQEQVDNHLKQFHDYDQAVTCVAGWHYLLKEMPQYQPFTRHFEWFPRVECNGQEKTPDFTALLIRGGILGEIKASLPRDDSAFDSELRQIAAYTEVTKLPTHDGSWSEPTHIDVVLLVQDACADEVAQRVIDRCSDPSHWFKPQKRPIVMAYFFTQEYGNTRFVMRRVQLQGNGEFGRMQTNPEGEDLYYYLCEKKGSIRLRPEAWADTKAKYMIMNDAPPPIFCGTFLWQYIIRYAMSAKGYRPDLMRSSVYFPVEISAAEISNRIRNDVLYNNALSIRLIRNGLQFLCEADLADVAVPDSDTVTVRLQPGIGAKSGVRGAAGEPVDVARELAIRHAKAAFAKKGRARRSAPGTTANLVLPLDL